MFTEAPVYGWLAHCFRAMARDTVWPDQLAGLSVLAWNRKERRGERVLRSQYPPCLQQLEDA